MIKTQKETDTTIKTESSQEIVDIELYYKNLYAIKDPNLLLTTSLKGRSIGTRASLIQFISTWARYSNNGKLITYINNKKDAETQLNNLCEEFHGLAAIQMVSGQDIVDRKGVHSLKTDAKKIAENKITEYKEYSNKFKANYKQRDESVMLMSLDNTICEYPQYFYDIKNKILNESSFISVVQTILNIISKTSKSNKISSTSLLEIADLFNDDKLTSSDLGKIAKELIENTECWAKEKFDSREIYTPNLRGLILQFHSNGVSKENKSSSNDPMNIFIQSIDKRVKDYNATTKKKQKKVAFFELSIFDTGPGLARRMSKIDYEGMTIENEYNYVLDCFKQNITTDLSGASDLRGLGLAKVLKILGEIGFIRIRSGRLNLYRNFYIDKLNVAEEINNKKFKFKDWQSQDFDLPQKMPVAEGTLLTIVYPFSY